MDEAITQSKTSNTDAELGIACGMIGKMFADSGLETKPLPTPLPTDQPIHQ